MEITEEQMFDYINCPCYYDMKHNKGIKVEEKITMQTLMEKIIRYFYSCLLDKKDCSMNDLKKKWDNLCKQNKDFITKEKNLEGLGFVVDFARWASENKIVLIDFDSTYCITVEDIELTGTLGAVMAKPNRKCELTISKFSKSKPLQIILDKKLKYTLDCYAFKQAYDHDIDMVKIVNFKDRKEYFTQRNQTDFDRLESTIIGVANGIKNKSFYPRETVFCSTCKMNQYCRFWN